MKINFKTLLSFILVSGLLIFLCCEKDDKNSLTVSTVKIEIPKEGDTTSFIIETDAGSWNIENPAEEWLKLSVKTGTQKKALISLSVNSKTLLPRKDSLKITAGDADPVYVVVTQASSEYLYELKSSRTYADFGIVSGSVSMIITSDAPKWTLKCDSAWVQFSQTEGAPGTITVNISVPTNTNTNIRTANITLSAENAPTTIIPVSQKGTFPSYNTNPLSPDNTGMISNAEEIAAKIKIGWNIGNTMEAMGGETAWGNPKITSDLIKLVKQNGFDAIRIPCSWNQYANQTTAQINATWLNRVKEVVQYCVDNDVYVILNIHWDGGWLENNCTPAAKELNNLKQKAYWEQIATHLRDFDEHLMFASANEPNVENSTQMSVLNSYHQTFIDAVRATGGKNSYRVLVIQGPSTDIEKTKDLMSVWPIDKISNRLMAEIHYYTPYQFCLMTEDATWGKMFYYWGKDYHSLTMPDRNSSWGEEAKLDELIGMMKTKFVDKGIPVIMGEYAAIRRTSLTDENLDLHIASRAYFLKYLTKQARTNGILPFYWDAGNMGVNASALFNRTNNTIYDKQALDSLIQGSIE